MSETRFRRLVAAAAVVAGMTVPLMHSAPAAAAPPVPRAPVTLPAAIEALPQYDPASTCSPTAKPGSTKLMNLLLKTYPSSRSLGISRSCSSGGRSEHKEGRALDWGTRAWVANEKANADAFVKWALSTDSRGNKYQGARRLGIMYMIWNDRIWSASNASAGWRPYLHPYCSSLSSCNATLRHRDHVHISLSWPGAKGATSFWTGKVGSGSNSSAGTTNVNPTQVSSFDHTVLREGSQGRAVYALQKALRMRYVTGNFGDITAAAVRDYQRKHNLPTTGVVASMTWGALKSELAREARAIDEVKKFIVRPGATGRAVRVLEAAINMPVNGKYTKSDIYRVRIFQRAHKIRDTGNVGGPTWAALRGI